MFEIILVSRPILLALEAKNDIFSQINEFLEQNIRCCEDAVEKMKISSYRKDKGLFCFDNCYCSRLLFLILFILYLLFFFFFQFSPPNNNKNKTKQ